MSLVNHCQRMSRPKERAPNLDEERGNVQAQTKRAGPPHALPWERPRALGQTTFTRVHQSPTEALRLSCLCPSLDCLLSRRRRPGRNARDSRPASRTAQAPVRCAGTPTICRATQIRAFPTQPSATTKDAGPTRASASQVSPNSWTQLRPTRGRSSTQASARETATPRRRLTHRRPPAWSANAALPHPLTTGSLPGGTLPRVTFEPTPGPGHPSPHGQDFQCLPGSPRGLVRDPRRSLLLGTTVASRPCRRLKYVLRIPAPTPNPRVSSDIRPAASRPTPRSVSTPTTPPSLAGTSSPRLATLTTRNPISAGAPLRPPGRGSTSACIPTAARRFRGRAVSGFTSTRTRVRGPTGARSAAERSRSLRTSSVISVGPASPSFGEKRVC